MTDPLSLRAYARHRGIAPVSVIRAVERGRLKECLVYDAQGHAKIVDVELADREWEARTDLSKAPGYVKERSAQVSPAPSLPLPAESDDDQEPPAEDDEPAEELAARPSLAEASAREKHFKAQLAELEYKRRSGELVNAREVEARWGDAIGRARTRLLGVPRKAKQLLPHLNHADVTTLDNLVREALEELAGPAPTFERDPAEGGAPQ